MAGLLNVFIMKSDGALGEVRTHNLSVKGRLLTIHVELPAHCVRTNYIMEKLVEDEGANPSRFPQSAGFRLDINQARTVGAVLYGRSPENRIQ